MNGAWTSTQILQAIGGFTMVLFSVALLKAAFRLITVEVEDETLALITSFGRLSKTIKAPGLHFFPQKAMPWVRVIPVSLQRDFRHYKNIQVNDRKGTTVIVDLWLEFRVVDAERALFQIENWELSLQSLLTHSATSILGVQNFEEILENRGELGSKLKQDIVDETTRWGLRIEEVFIRQVSLLSEVSKQMFEAVGARLERAKADVEEKGRLRVEELDAKTTAQVAQLLAEAKGQYPAAIGRAYSRLSKEPVILKAYKELYELSLIRPHRTVSFQGFAENEVRPLDALMANAPAPDFSSLGFSQKNQNHSLESLQ